MTIGRQRIARRHRQRDAVEQLGAHLFAQWRVALVFDDRAGALEQVDQEAAQLAEHGGVGVVQARAVGGGGFTHGGRHVGLEQRAVHLDADHHVALRREELEAVVAREHMQRVAAGGAAAEARIAFEREWHADGEHVPAHPAGLVHRLVQVFDEEADAVELQALHGAVEAAARELQVALVPALQRGGLFVDVAEARERRTAKRRHGQRNALHRNGGHGRDHGR